jgi:hypothetical protein
MRSVAYLTDRKPFPFRNGIWLPSDFGTATGHDSFSLTPAHPGGHHTTGANVMTPSRFTSLIAGAALSVGALTALVAPAAIAQAQPKETFMCWIDQTSYDPGTKVDFADGSTLMCQKDGNWKNIGPNKSGPLMG